MSWTLEQTRAYHRGYERKRRARCRRLGLCVLCERQKRRGLAPNGKPFAKCQQCIDRSARFGTAWRLARRRRGFCVSCPRRRPRGDKHWNCPRCRSARRGYSAAYYQRRRDAVLTQRRRRAA